MNNLSNTVMDNLSKEELEAEERAIDMYLSVDPNWCPPNQMALDILPILRKMDQNEFETEAERKAFYLSEISQIRVKHAAEGFPLPSVAPLGLQLLKAGLITAPRETVRALIRETKHFNGMLLGAVRLTPAGEATIKAVKADSDADIP